VLLSSGDTDTLHGADALFMKQLLTTLKLSRLKQDNFVSFVDIKTKLIRAIFIIVYLVYDFIINIYVDLIR